MKPAWTSIIISSAIHLVFLFSVISFASLSNHEKEAVVIDFSVREPALKTSSVIEKKPQKQLYNFKKHVQPKSQPIDKPSFPDPDTTVINEIDSTSLVFDDTDDDSIDTSGTSTEKTETTTDASQKTEQILQQKRQQYLREQFEYIRNIIYRKASYPSVAIDLKLTGTVFISFCVREDISALARQFIMGLTLMENDVAIIDTEAGIEHFGRGLDKLCDATLMVVEPSRESMCLVSKINAMAESIEVPLFYILNKTDCETSQILQAVVADKSKILGEFIVDAQLLDAGLEGRPVPLGYGAAATVIEKLQNTSLFVNA